MNFRIFISTFVLIFLAELGDKTQLAAMARAATNEGAKWTVFLATASALVISALVAVLLGSTLTRFVPERTIRLTAGILFLLFGILIVRRAFVEPKPAGGRGEGGALTRLIFHEAAEFEAASFAGYRDLAAQATDAPLRALLEELAADEDAHYRRLTAYRKEHEDAPAAPVPNLQLPALPPVVTPTADDPLARAMEHEEATAHFYAELAGLSPLPTVKRAFQSLAAAEEDHVRRLREFARDRTTAAGA